MTRFADPARCPDCRTVLTPGSFICPWCRLDLSGDLGRQLFTLLTDADRVLVQMRARSSSPVVAPEPARAEQARVPVGAGGPAVPPPPMVPPGSPNAFPRPAAPPPAPRGATVPQVLLGLGALTLLVAISLFLAVTWAALGPSGRALVLVLLTCATGTVTAFVARRDLRAATEAIGLVTLGLVAGDVVAARDAGWLHPGNGAQLALVLGTVLVLAGTVSALALTRTRAARFISGEVVAAIGAACVAGGVADSDWSSTAGRLVVAVPLVAVLAVLARLLGQLLPEGPSDPAFLPLPEHGTPAPRRLLPMQVETAGIALVTVVTWLALTLAALGRVMDDLTLAGVWGGAGLPLLAAGVYAALPALLPGPRTARVSALAVAVLPLTVLVTAPAYDESGTTLALVTAAVTLVLAAVLATGPLPWVRAAGSGLVVTVPILVVHSLALLAAGIEAYADAVRQGWTGTPDGRLDPHVADLAAPWVLPMALLVLVVTGFAVHRGVTGTRPTRQAVLRVAETSAIVALHGGLLVVHTPVVLLLAVMLLTTLRVGIDGMRGHPRMPEEAAAWTSVVLGGLALALSAYDEWLTLLACVVLGGLAVLHHRSRSMNGWGAWIGGLVLGPLGAVALWAVASLAEVQGEWAALVVLLALGAWLVLRGLAEPDGPTPAPALDAVTDPAATPRAPWVDAVVGVEIGTVLAAATSALIGATAYAPVDEEPTWVAVYLTVLGVIASVVSLTRPERRRVGGWSAFLLLTAASWVRLADIGVHQPEAYTVPSALVLLVVGWFTLRGDEAVGTMRVWSSGLGLALVPSLLWVLADPVSLRALVLGLVCLGLVLLGSNRRWAAPFVWGSAVGTVLVLRMVAPVALLVGPFLVFALGGVLLLVVGATWEQRLKDADRLRANVRAMR